jgi:hypothetical protein
MSWSDEVSDGQREALSDGAGVIIKWFGKNIPAIQGSGISANELVDGGTIATETPTFSILKSDISTLAPGKKFDQGQEIQIDGKILYVSSVSFDVADPCVKISTVGETQ